MDKKRKNLIKKADKLWADLIKVRDKECQMCGGEVGNAHHIIGRSVKAIRWDLLNGVGLCVPCHFKVEGDPFMAASWATEKYGRARIEYLTIKKRNRLKTDVSNLEMIIKYLEEESASLS